MWINYFFLLVILIPHWLIPTPPRSSFPLGGWMISRLRKICFYDAKDEILKVGRTCVIKKWHVSSWRPFLSPWSSIESFRHSFVYRLSFNMFCFFVCVWTTFFVVDVIKDLQGAAKKNTHKKRIEEDTMRMKDTCLERRQHEKDEGVSWGIWKRKEKGKKYNNMRRHERVRATAVVHWLFFFFFFFFFF